MKNGSVPLWAAYILAAALIGIFLWAVPAGDRSAWALPLAVVGAIYIGRAVVSDINESIGKPNGPRSQTR